MERHFCVDEMSTITRACASSVRRASAIEDAAYRIVLYNLSLPRERLEPGLNDVFRKNIIPAIVELITTTAQKLSSETSAPAPASAADESDTDTATTTSSDATATPASAAAPVAAPAHRTALPRAKNTATYLEFAHWVKANVPTEHRDHVKSALTFLVHRGDVPRAVSVAHPGCDHCSDRPPRHCAGVHTQASTILQCMLPYLPLGKEQYVEALQGALTDLIHSLGHKPVAPASAAPAPAAPAPAAPAAAVPAAAASASAAPTCADDASWQDATLHALCMFGLGIHATPDLCQCVMRALRDKLTVLLEDPQHDASVLETVLTLPFDRLDKVRVMQDWLRALRKCPTPEPGIVRVGPDKCLQTFILSAQEAKQFRLVYDLCVANADEAMEITMQRLIGFWPQHARDSETHKELYDFIARSLETDRHAKACSTVIERSELSTAYVGLLPYLGPQTLMNAAFSLRKLTLNEGAALESSTHRSRILSIYSSHLCLPAQKEHKTLDHRSAVEAVRSAICGVAEVLAKYPYKRDKQLREHGQSSIVTAPASAAARATVAAPAHAPHASASSTSATVGSAAGAAAPTAAAPTAPAPQATDGAAQEVAAAKAAAQEADAPLVTRSRLSALVPLLDAALLSDAPQCQAPNLSTPAASAAARGAREKTRDEESAASAARLRVPAAGPAATRKRNRQQGNVAVSVAAAADHDDAVSAAAATSARLGTRRVNVRAAAPAPVAAASTTQQRSVPPALHAHTRELSSSPYDISTPDRSHDMTVLELVSLAGVGKRRRKRTTTSTRRT